MPVVPNPGIRIDGKLNNPKAATRKNLSTDMKVGRQNVFDYTDSAVSDGSTDARAAILAADAVGPVILPPGTYAIASNMTLSNKITFDPGAKLKPANGITVTLDSGYIAEDTQHVFDISAGGSVVMAERSYVTPEHFGAIADGSTNDFAALKAMFVAARDSGATAKSISDGRVYRIGSRIEFDDTYDGLQIDFTGDWIKATNLGWGSNDVVVMKNGSVAYAATARAFKHYTINIKELNIDGDYDFAGFLSDLEVAYDANPAMSDTDVLTEVSTAQGANGSLYNGFGQYVDPAGTGSANPTLALIADTIRVRNIGKGGVGLANPKGSHIKKLYVNNCVVHAFATDLALADTAIDSSEITAIVNYLNADSCQTVFDLSTTVAGYAAAYDTNKLGSVVIDTIESTNIINRTKIHGPWNLSWGEWTNGPQHRACRYPVFTVVDGLLERNVVGKYLSSDTSDGGIHGNCRWDLGTIRLKRVKRYATFMYGESAHIDKLIIDACPYPYRGNIKIGYCKYENTVPTNANYQCTSSVNYPFYSEGVTQIEKMEISDASIGIVSGSQTYATYQWFFNTASNGSYIKELVSSTTISAWPAVTAVVSGELRSQGGKLWQSNSSRTTGATFDGTEQTNWTEVGNGTGQTTHLAYMDDSAASEYLVEFGSITGNGYNSYALHQASSATTTKASVKVGSTDAGSTLGIGVIALRNEAITVENITQLKALRNVANGTVARTLGYSSIGDGGGGNEYVYQAISRPGTENAFQLYGTGTTDWWKAIQQDIAKANQFGATGDGTTNDRAAILAADTTGPVLLPPGTYAVASDMTLSNNIKFEPGAKLKPASGVTITLNGGYSAVKPENPFDISAGGSFVISKVIEDLGSLGSGTQVFSFNDGDGFHKKVIATGAIALQFTATVPGHYTAIVEMDGTGGHTITYATTVKGTAPTINTTASEKTIIPLFYDGATWFHV